MEPQGWQREEGEKPQSRLDELMIAPQGRHEVAARFLGDLQRRTEHLEHKIPVDCRQLGQSVRAGGLGHRHLRPTKPHRLRQQKTGQKLRHWVAWALLENESIS